jgi:hypothetical protein
MRHVSERDRAWKWKIYYWTTARDYAQRQLDYLCKGVLQLTDRDGHDRIADQIAQHERDLAIANERIEDLHSN